MLRYLDTEIVYKEVPGNVTLSYMITGCPNGCKNCHWNGVNYFSEGSQLSWDNVKKDIEKNKYLITCVLFFGGEWEINILKDILFKIKFHFPHLSTCLYTGKEFDHFSKEDIKDLDFIKVGEYIESKGGLESKETNQRFISLSDGSDLTLLFRKNRRMDERKGS